MLRISEFSANLMARGRAFFQSAFRGVSPQNRATQAGCAVVGTELAFATVIALDLESIVAATEPAIDEGDVSGDAFVFADDAAAVASAPEASDPAASMAVIAPDQFFELFDEDEYASVLYDEDALDEIEAEEHIDDFGGADGLLV